MKSVTIYIEKNNEQLHLDIIDFNQNPVLTILILSDERFLNEIIKCTKQCKVFRIEQTETFRLDIQQTEVKRNLMQDIHQFINDIEKRFRELKRVGISYKMFKFEFLRQSVYPSSNSLPPPLNEEG